MANPDLRAKALRLLNGLSDADRHQLHFYLSDHVPQYTGGDSSITGTLRVIQPLFDQGKLNDQNFTYLINAFNKSRCQEAVTLLKDLEEQSQPSSPIESSTSNPVIIEICDDQEDKNVTKTHSLLEGNSENQSMKKNFNTKRKIFSSVEHKHLFCVPLGINRMFLCLLLLLLIASGIFFPILFIGKFHMKRSSVQSILNNNTSIELQKNDSTIEQIPELTSPKEEEVVVSSTSLIKFGPIYGLATEDGNLYNYSSMEVYTYFYSLSGIELHENTDGSASDTIRFSTNPSMQLTIESETYSPSNTTIVIHENERIEKVEVQFIEENRLLPDGTSSNTSKLTGIQFHTKDNRIFGSLKEREGTTYSEYHQGYTLSYILGSATKEYTTQIQFVWYKTG